MSCTSHFKSITIRKRFCYSSKI